MDKEPEGAGAAVDAPEVQCAPEQQRELSLDEQVAESEGTLRETLELGISILSDRTNGVELNMRLKQILQALDSGDLNFLEQCTPGSSTPTPDIYAYTVGMYIESLKEREAGLCKEGMDPEAVLRELLEVRVMEMKVHGYAEDSKGSFCSRQENEARGALKVLRTALKAVKGSSYPIAVIRKMQEDAKAWEDAFRKAFADVRSRITIDTLKLAIAANRCGEEIGGHQALEEAINILSGGEVAKVQACICRAVSRLFGHIKVGEKTVLLIREGGWDTDEAFLKELGENTGSSAFSTPEVVERECIEGTRREVLQWAAPKMAEGKRRKHDR